MCSNNNSEMKIIYFAVDFRGGPPGSSMMYPPGMGPDSHPGNSPLFHGPTSHPHAPPPHPPPPHHPSHMASSPMIRMPGAPPPPPGNIAAMNAAAAAAEMSAFNPAAAAAHLNPHMMQQHPSPLQSSTTVMRASQALPPEPPSPKRGVGGGGSQVNTSQSVGAGGTSFSNIGGHHNPQNVSTSVGTCCRSHHSVFSNYVTSLF